MKTAFLAISIFLGLASANAHGQRTTSVTIGWNLPAATVEVLNNTSDGSMIGPVIDGSQDRRLTPRGKTFKRVYPDTAFGFNGPKSVSYHIYACPSVVDDQSTMIRPPNWAAQEAYFGELAITKTYLESNPAEKELTKRVHEIIKALEKRDELGRKQKEEDLKDWLKEVKKVGLQTSGQVCSADATILSGVIDVTNYYGWRTILIEVQGSAAEGYSYSINGRKR